jgi:ribose-phosphate pyrophosphokinase
VRRTARPRRPAALFAFPEQAALGRRLARRLGWAYRGVEVHRFPDAESRVRLRGAPWRGRAVVLRSLDDPNRKVLETLLAVATLRERGASRVDLVAPYLGYMRQDAAFAAGEAVSQRIVADLLGGHVDSVLTVDAHLHRTAFLADVFPVTARSLSAAPLFAARARRTGAALVVGPDAESARWARAVATGAGLPCLVARKERRGDRDVRVVLPAGHGVRGRDAVLVDDIACTARTAIEAVRALRAARARSVQVFVTHALFVPGAEAALRESGAEAIVSTNSVPHATNGEDVAGILVEALSGSTGRRA